MDKYHLPLYEGNFYHIFNKGNNSDNLFYQQRNYKYFLIQYNKYLSDYLDTYAYCLLPNHFHLLVRVKNKDEKDNWNLKKGKKILTETDVIVSELFRRFFTSYAKSINKQEKRHGSLFIKNFKRKKVSSTNYFANLVYYIHRNPEQHGIYDDYKFYPWSSYERILINKPTKLQKQAVLNWFTNKNNYQSYHIQKQNLDNIEHLIIEN